jgi:hypothetical protein
MALRLLMLALCCLGVYFVINGGRSKSPPRIEISEPKRASPQGSETPALGSSPMDKLRPGGRPVESRPEPQAEAKTEPESAPVPFALPPPAILSQPRTMGGIKQELSGRPPSEPMAVETSAPASLPRPAAVQPAPPAPATVAAPPSAAPVKPTEPRSPDAAIPVVAGDAPESGEAMAPPVTKPQRKPSSESRRAEPSARPPRRSGFASTENGL